MSMIQSDLLLGQEGGAGYTISRSLRFNSSDSAYLSRTPASAGNRKTWTWAGWVKGVATSENPHLFTCTTGATDATYFRLWFVSDSIRVSNYNNNLRQTSAVYRDPSAWYHIVLAVDTTQATAANRIKLYVNGSEVTAFSSSVNPNQNDDLGINQAAAHSIGATSAGTATLSAYLADIHFIDGQALDPSSFTEVDATTGQLIPKAYSGSFGTNGFWLKFSDNSAATATTLGKDYSGNSNNWTPNNLSVTAGAGNDSLVDTPTSYGTDTGAGGEVRGNYATLNPLANPGSSTLSNGNLDVVTASASYGKVNGTIAVSSGKWYWEVVCTVRNQDAFIGIEGVANANTNTYTGGSATGTGWYNGGAIYSNDSSTSYGTTYVANDVIGVALDMDAGTLVFYKNGVTAGTAKTGLSGSFTASVSDGATSGSGNTYVCNFGQRQWAYAAPAGFKALCDTNLPAPTIALPSTVMDVKLYTGNGSTQTIGGLGFSPDLVWIKERSSTSSHQLYDTIRGATNTLYSNSGNEEQLNANALTSFTSTGFNVGVDNNVNQSAQTYAAWAWDAGSSTVTNNSGSISSQVRANASAGFSIVTYTGTGANATVGHGLGAAPDLVIVKRRSTTGDWQVRHISITPANSIQLNLDSLAAAATTVWNSTAPSSTVFSVGTNATVNASGGTYVAYCWSRVNSFSSIGSYVGNGSTDGPFVFTGMRPRWVLIKGIDGGDHWYLYDSARLGYNPRNEQLTPNLSDAEYDALSYPNIDICANGFKLRTTIGGRNASGVLYAYAAFAENPFQYARAR